MQTAKHDLMRNTNTLNVLECIMKRGPITKRDLQAETGLSWGSISNITNELLHKRVVTECKSTDSVIGRIPVKLDINGRENLIVGLDINIEGLTAVLIDLKCRVLNERRAGIARNEPAAILEQVKQLVNELIVDSHIGKPGLLGIGVAMQGAVDVTRGLSIFSPHFLNWNNVPIGSILEQEFDLPVYVEHDPNCMALAERWLGEAREVVSLLFLRLAMGIGMSIIINGEIYRGADGSAGEFGHTIINPGGPRCTCGNNGCLEAYASGSSILRKAVEGVTLGRAPVMSALAGGKTDFDLDLVIAAARQDDAYAKGLFEEAGAYLGVGISNLINIFNPDLVIISGKMAQCGELYLNRTQQVASEKAWKSSRINLAFSKLENNAAAIGAAAIYLQKIFKEDQRQILKAVFH